MRDESARSSFFTQRPLFLIFMLGAGIFLLWAAVKGWPGSVTAVDLNQHRADIALPSPPSNQSIRQSFTPRHDGLSEIEVLLVRYGEAGEDAGGRLTFQLVDDTGALVAEQVLETAPLTHNQTFAFRFGPEASSAGRPYTLILRGNEQNPVSVWGYDLDVLSGAELDFDGESAARDLRLVTRYQLTWGSAVTYLVKVLGNDGPLLALALVLLFVPGGVLLLWFRPRWEPAAFVGAAIALGAAVWPVLWLWLTWVGGRWSGPLLWGLVAGAWGVGLWRALRGSRFTFHVSRQAWLHYLTLFGLLVLGLAVRLLAVRDLAFPPWVDASRHALITAVMVERGQTITDYAPLLPIDYFPYHAGFHTIPAALVLMTGRPLPELLLVVGQWLNALVPLMIYAAVWLVTRRQAAALLAAFLVALPFFFPAYYATWGRFTQLTAVLVMPVLLALTWLLVYGARGWRRGWWLVGLLAAGLFLIHFRVFLLFLPFPVLVWLVARGRHGRWLAAAAILALLLVGPRLTQLAVATEPAAVFSNNIPGYNDFPTGYFTVGWERHFIVLIALCLLLSLLAFIRRRAWATLPLVLAAWVGLLFLLLSGRALGLPETWLINLNSLVITLFVPAAMIVGGVGGRLWRWLTDVGHVSNVTPAPTDVGHVSNVTPHPPAEMWRRIHDALMSRGIRDLLLLALGAGMAAALLFGVRQQITILNEQTILAWPQDLDGLRWVAENVPEDAFVAVNAWQWLGTTWAGGDGGAWLLPLTGRQSTTPPADYIYSRPLAEQVNAFNQEAMAVEDWSQPAAAEWLRAQGVTHVFVGARGGFFDPAALGGNPAVEMVYGRDGVFIFTLNSNNRQ